MKTSDKDTDDVTADERDGDELLREAGLELICLADVEPTKVVRYAYVHKRLGRERSGLLEACDYKDARRHLGSSFRIKKIELYHDAAHYAMFDPDARWKIVAQVFGMEENGEPSTKQRKDGD